MSDTNRFFERNIPSISPEEQASLADKTVLICGCGGLGGFILEDMVRLGVGRIVIFDGDDIDESNLNRQLFTSSANIGKSKVLEAFQRMKNIRPDAGILPMDMYLNEQTLPLAEDALKTLSGRDKPDLILDALDTAEDRLFLESLAEKWNVPLVHGAVEGWRLQTGVCMPGSRMISGIYSQEKNGQSAPSDSGNADAAKSCLIFTVQTAAALQAAEALKLLIGKPSELENKLFIADFLEGESFTIDYE